MIVAVLQGYRANRLSKLVKAGVRPFTEVRDPWIAIIAGLGNDFVALPVRRDPERLQFVVRNFPDVGQDEVELHHLDVPANVLWRFEMRPMVRETGSVGDFGTRKAFT